jgi:hypothetical protein
LLLYDRDPKSDIRYPESPIRHLESEIKKIRNRNKHPGSASYTVRNFHNIPVGGEAVCDAPVAWDGWAAVEPAGGAGRAPLRMRRRQDDGQGRQEHCPGNMPGKIGRIRIIFARFGSCPFFSSGNKPGEIGVADPIGSAYFFPLRTKHPFLTYKFLPRKMAEGCLYFSFCQKSSKFFEVPKMYLWAKMMDLFVFWVEYYMSPLPLTTVLALW